MQDADRNQKLNFRAHYRQICSEQDEVRQYVLTKYLQRPRTNAVTVSLWILGYVAVAFGVASATVWACHIRTGAVWVYIGSYALCLVIIAKCLCIKLVECYQHYAKEATRRKCLCKPTCSEYAIAVLKKYMLAVALYKIWKRLFKTWLLESIST